MRRFKILWFWLTKSRNNVGLLELIMFMCKPTVQSIATRYIAGIDSSSDVDFYLIKFNKTPQLLYWPKHFPIAGIYQVTAETMDTYDWHYYRKPETPILQGEHIVDVGTAEGLLPLVVAEQCASLTLIEPNPYFVTALKRSFEKFGSKVKIIESAIAEIQSEVSFSPDALAGTLSTHGVENVTVRANMLDNLISPEQPVTYLKADIEGYEEIMLLGARRIITVNKPKIAITSYHTQNSPSRIIEIIKGYVPEYHYKVKGIDERVGKPVMIHFWVPENS